MAEIDKSIGVSGLTNLNSSPVSAQNPPSHSCINYRTDDYNTLRHKLLQRLKQVLPSWNTELAMHEGSQDMAIFFTEAFAYMVDILGYYQNRNANEAFIRTCSLDFSLIEMSRLIGHQISPGVSASTLQVFLLKPGQSGILPAKYQVQSRAVGTLPAFTFETGRPLYANAGRNRLRLSGYNRSIQNLNDPVLQNQLLLDAQYDGLKAGAFVVLIDSSTIPTGVTALQLTSVTLEEGKSRLFWKLGALGQKLPIADLSILGKAKQKMVLADKARADEITAGQRVIPIENAGGFSAGIPVLFSSEGIMLAAKTIGVDTVSAPHTVTINRGLTISLRASRTRMFIGKFIGYVSGPVRLGATVLTYTAHAAFAQPGDYLLVSDKLGVEIIQVAEHPTSNTIYLSHPTSRAFYPDHQSHIGFSTIALYYVRVITPGMSAFSNPMPAQLLSTESVVVLEKAYEGLNSGQELVLSDGLHLATATVDKVEINADQLSVITFQIPIGTTFDISKLTIHGPFEHTMRVHGYNHSEQMTIPHTTGVSLAGEVLDLKPGDYLVMKDAFYAQSVRIASLALSQGNTNVELVSPLENAYVKGDCIVYGNVVPISHGATRIEEMLGSGDSSVPNQRFTLQNLPTTYVHDPQERHGLTNTLEVFIDGEKWLEVESLAGSKSDDRHYVVDIDEDRRMSFRFGDGVHGATVTTGQNNVRVRYRTGLGGDANVAAGAITQMPAPVDFLESTFNPLSAAGGTDREHSRTTKRVAPVSVRTLDRAVSLSDYADLALTYVGIAKAKAQWNWDGNRRIIVLTVATSQGKPLTAEYENALRHFLDDRRCVTHHLRIRNFISWPVFLEIEAHVLSGFLKIDTKSRIEQALGAGVDSANEPGYFHFERHDLGEDLYLSDVYAQVEQIPGVDFAVVKAFNQHRPTVSPVGIVDRIKVPAHALATGGHVLDASVGRLIVKAVGGIE